MSSASAAVPEPESAPAPLATKKLSRAERRAREREATKAAIAKRGVRLQRGDEVDVDPELVERCLKVVEHFHVGRCIPHQPADQKFKAEIIDPPPLFFIGFLRRCDPGVDHPVADRQDDGVQPVMRLGGGGSIISASNSSSGG